MAMMTIGNHGASASLCSFFFMEAYVIYAGRHYVAASNAKGSQNEKGKIDSGSPTVVSTCNQGTQFLA